ncbi:hypothetical protein PG985_012269 [Apiospora marii]|uniref:uncharacterized protein n=1 Tax=Apiospora marii TaxID=335849 RepID=UPI00312EB38F
MCGADEPRPGVTPPGDGLTCSTVAVGRVPPHVSEPREVLPGRQGRRVPRPDDYDYYNVFGVDLKVAAAVDAVRILEEPLEVLPPVDKNDMGDGAVGSQGQAPRQNTAAAAAAAASLL